MLLAYAATAVFAFAFDKIYALFAHGVESPYMRWLFVYPLVAGFVWAVGYSLFRTRLGRGSARIGFNLYNMGLAALMAGSLLHGIFDIAGTASPYTAWFFMCGAALVCMAALAWLVAVLRASRRPVRRQHAAIYIAKK